VNRFKPSSERGGGSSTSLLFPGGFLPVEHVWLKGGGREKKKKYCWLIPRVRQGGKAKGGRARERVEQPIKLGGGSPWKQC